MVQPESSLPFKAVPRDDERFFRSGNARGHRTQFVSSLRCDYRLATLLRVQDAGNHVLIFQLPADDLAVGDAVIDVAPQQFHEGKVMAVPHL